MFAASTTPSLASGTAASSAFTCSSASAQATAAGAAARAGAKVEGAAPPLGENRSPGEEIPDAPRHASQLVHRLDNLPRLHVLQAAHAGVFAAHFFFEPLPEPRRHSPRAVPVTVRVALSVHTHPHTTEGMSRRRLLSWTPSNEVQQALSVATPILHSLLLFLLLHTCKIAR